MHPDLLKKWQPETPGEWLAMIILSIVLICGLMWMSDVIAYNTAPEGSVLVKLQEGSVYNLTHLCADDSVQSTQLSIEVTSKHRADVMVTGNPVQTVGIADDLSANIGCQGEQILFADMKVVNNGFDYVDILLYPEFRIEEVLGGS